MKIKQSIWTSKEGWKGFYNQEEKFENCLVLAFGNRFVLEDGSHYDELRDQFPNADILMGTTAGEIIGQQVHDDSIVATAIQFEKTSYQIEKLNSKDFENSYQLGKTLVDNLSKDGLRHVMVLSDGSTINGSELVKGLNDHLPEKVTTTGGLAGDGPRFEKTLVGCNAVPSRGNVVAIGLYGEDLQIGYGSVGGWDTFGPKRTITKATSNVLYELDGQSALDLYKKYLGDKADGLPGSALLFPLSINTDEGSKTLVRTILNVSEEDQSMTFAGDMPVGASAQLMKANFDKLIDGAYEAANSGKAILGVDNPQFALLISCVGRKLVLDQRIEEEVESVAEVIGDKIPVTGFYSYGEIAPFAGLKNCELHNQTMTVTLFGEK